MNVAMESLIHSASQIQRDMNFNISVIYDSFEIHFCSESNYFLLLGLKGKWDFYQRLKLVRYKLNLHSVTLGFFVLPRKYE